MQTKICCFAGHAEFPNKKEIKIKLKNEIINLIENHGINVFYSGGKGDFDWLCANTLHELKKNYQFIKSYWILSYMPKGIDIFYEKNIKLFDGSVYPDIEKTPLRFAIIKRNEWMIDISDFLIAYVEHSWGGAYKTLTYARKKII